MDPGRVYAAWGEEAERTVIDVLRGGVYVKGPHVAAFEAAFARDAGTRHAVAVDSGTEALALVLRAVLHERPADRREVILPTFTFVATASAVVNAGGVPVFADVLEDTQNLDPVSVAAHLSPATAAVVPVHLYGAPAAMDELREVIAAGRGADEGVFVLEDAAQAIHAESGGRRAGALGDAAAFSFYPSKNLGAAGDGGVVTTDDDALAARVRALRDHGQTRKMYDHELIGTNGRMDEIQAAVLGAKLPHVARWTRARRALAARYEAAFSGSAIRTQRQLPETLSAWHQFTVRVGNRDALRTVLAAEGIGSGVYYPMPLDRQTCFRRFSPAACPTAGRLAGQVLSLPCFPGLSEAEQDRVVQVALRAARA
jgi:dTDP-4-amino-4,6-dideoxygalactose transaminase